MKYEQHPEMKPITQSQVDDDRRAQADEVGKQAMDLERMDFSTKDLKDFSAMTNSHAEQTYAQKKQVEKPQEKQAEPKKDFYEQLLDSQQQH